MCLGWGFGLRSGWFRQMGGGCWPLILGSTCRGLRSFAKPKPLIKQLDLRGVRSSRALSAILETGLPPFICINYGFIITAIYNFRRGFKCVDGVFVKHAHPRHRRQTLEVLERIYLNASCSGQLCRVVVGLLLKSWRGRD